MKLLTLLALTVFVNISFAAETSTDCPMMRQGRSNPKANMVNLPKQAVRSSSQKGSTM